jgi:hypothetical protein
MAAMMMMMEWWWWLKHLEDFPGGAQAAAVRHPHKISHQSPQPTAAAAGPTGPAQLGDSRKKKKTSCVAATRRVTRHAAAVESDDCGSD